MKQIVLNPQYKLRNDIDRILLFSDDSTTTLIHPLQAMVLSFFDKPDFLDNTIQKASHYLGISRKHIEDFVEPLIMNQNKTWVGENNNATQLPEDLIVEEPNDYLERGYDFHDFMIDKIVNLQDLRLRKPLDFLFVINTQCFTDCLYCYADRSKRMDLQIPLERVFEIFEESKKIGINKIDFSGGDFFLCKNWDLILKSAIDNGFNPKPSTKTPITDDIIKRLKEIGAKSIQFSVDSLNQSILTKLLSVPNDYWTRIDHSIRKTNEAGIHFRVNSLITNYNCDYDSVCNLIDYLLHFDCFDEISIGKVGFSLYKTEDENKAFLTNYNDSNQLLEKLRTVYNGEKKVIVGSSSSPDELKMTDKKFTNKARCTANYSSFVLLPDGKVTICEELYWHPQFIIGDLLQQSILEMWNSSKALKLANLSKEDVCDSCRKCNHFEYCHKYAGKCWKQILKAYGRENWFYPDPACPNAPKPLYILE